jgi:hypothetical protein
VAISTALSLADLEAFDSRSPDRGRERRFWCPLPGCSDRRRTGETRDLSVNLDTGLYVCYRCGGAGKLRDRWQPRREMQQATLRRVFEGNQPTPPSKEDDEKAAIWKAAFAASADLEGSPGAAYLLKRGIPTNLAAAAGVRFHPKWYDWNHNVLPRPAVLFPVSDQYGQLVAVESRFIDERKPKSLSAGPKGDGCFVVPGALAVDPLVIVESPICALTLALCDAPAVALCGKGMPWWLPKAGAFKTVALALDADIPGGEACERLAPRFSYGSKVERWKPLYWLNDWNGVLQRHGEAELRKALGTDLPADMDDSRCIICGAEVFVYAPNGLPYCEEHDVEPVNCPSCGRQTGHVNRPCLVCMALDHGARLIERTPVEV